MIPPLKIIITAAASATIVTAQSENPVFSGGDTTVFETGKKSFARPLANIKRITRRHHAVGNSFFNQNWIAAPASTAARDGLGPLFNARSCSACHVQDGRGRPPEGDEFALGLIIRFSKPNQQGPHGEPVGIHNYGGQLAERALPGVTPEGNLKINYQKIRRIYADGTPYTLRKPIYSFSNLNKGPLPDDTGISPRVAPAVHGLGLLEAIAEEDILALADPDDTNGDGISGKANRVYDISNQSMTLGRFGWKANQPSLRQQSAAAFLNDIGITSSIFPKENHTSSYLNKLPNGGSPELSDKILGRVTTYLQTLAPPARRNISDPVVMRGEELFHNLKCASCHTHEHQTRSDFPLAELAEQTIRPYTDLLLHDMGSELADGASDHLASGREWRTPPLWGIGLQETVNGHTTFLHDGRARNLTEAILWHGGEAKSSQEMFKQLNANDREAMITFLNSL